MGHRNVFDQRPEEGPDLPTIDELLEVETDPEVLAQLTILKNGLEGGEVVIHNPKAIFGKFEGVKVDRQDVEEWRPSDIDIVREDVRQHRKAQHKNLEEN